MCKGKEMQSKMFSYHISITDDLSTSLFYYEVPLGILPKLETSLEDNLSVAIVMSMH